MAASASLARFCSPEFASRSERSSSSYLASGWGLIDEMSTLGSGKSKCFSGFFFSTYFGFGVSTLAYYYGLGYSYCLGSGYYSYSSFEESREPNDFSWRAAIASCSFSTCGFSFGSSFFFSCVLIFYSDIVFIV